MKTPYLKILKSGLLAFSPSATVMIGLKDKDKILFFQDEENPEDWYIQQTNKSEGFTIRVDPKRYALFNSVILVRLLFKFGNKEGKSCKFMISDQALKLENSMDAKCTAPAYLIITSSCQ